MPSLRELFEKIPSGQIHRESKAFLAALLEVVELQECPQGCDTIIHKLRSRIRALEALEPEDTPTDEQWNDARDARVRQLQDKLSEAKAEIERLRGKCEWKELCKGYPGLCTEAEMVVKSIKADAEVGRLVRGMRQHTCLHRGAASWWAEDKWKVHFASVTDPAETLKMIQEEGDDPH